MRYKTDSSCPARLPSLQESTPMKSLILATSRRKSTAGTQTTAQAILSGRTCHANSISQYLDLEVRYSTICSLLPIQILITVTHHCELRNHFFKHISSPFSPGVDADDFAHTHINDIGLIPVSHATTGAMGFNIVLGGYFSIKRAAESIPMGVWIPEADALDLCKAILRLFRDMGARGDRQKARLMWLIEAQGLDAFVSNVAAEMSSYKGLSSPLTFEPAQKYTGSLSEWSAGHRYIVGVHPQKQAGKSWVGIHVPVGRLSATECDEIATLADKYSAGEIRFTVEQNIILPNVDSHRAESLLADLALTTAGSRLSAAPGNIVGNVISCTGSQFCGLALVETKLKIDRMTRQLQEMVEVPRPVRIHMTGCPNSCGQAQIADIGLMGAPAKKADSEGVMKAVSGTCCPALPGNIAYAHSHRSIHTHKLP